MIKLVSKHFTYIVSRAGPADVASRYQKPIKVVELTYYRYIAVLPSDADSLGNLGVALEAIRYEALGWIKRGVYVASDNIVKGIINVFPALLGGKNYEFMIRDGPNSNHLITMKDARTNREPPNKEQFELLSRDKKPVIIRLKDYDMRAMMNLVEPSQQAVTSSTEPSSQTIVDSEFLTLSSALPSTQTSALMSTHTSTLLSNQTSALAHVTAAPLLQSAYIAGTDIEIPYDMLPKFPPIRVIPLCDVEKEQAEADLAKEILHQEALQSDDPDGWETHWVYGICVICRLYNANVIYSPCMHQPYCSVHAEQLDKDTEGLAFSTHREPSQPMFSIT